MNQEALVSPTLIHIGFPKSLSSWMQKKLFVPEHGYQTILNPLLAKICIIDPAPFRFEPEHTLETVKKNKTLDKLIPVITAENLCGNILSGGNDAQINAERLKICFPKAKILIVIREQISLIRSLYKTQINWGMPYSIEELIIRKPPFLIPEFNIEMLKFDGIITHYQELYGKENVLVLPYEEFKINPDTFCQSIAIFCENHLFKNENINFKQKINTNRPLIDIYFDRAKNRMSKSAFNYNGIFTENEEKLAERLKSSKKKDRFPKFTHNWFEKSFSEKTNRILKNEFIESNKLTKLITGIPLEKYDYQL